MRINTGICFAGNAASDNIADPDYLCSLFPCQLDGSKSIGCFTALAYCNYNISLFDYRIPVPEFRSIFNFNRDPGIFLKNIFSKKSCMP